MIHTHSSLKKTESNSAAEVRREEEMEKKITNSSSSTTSTSLPLHTYQVQTLRATLNRLHILFHLTTLLSLIYYRISRILSVANAVPTTPWILLTVSELILSFIWFFTQSFRWRPVSRTAFQERINPDQIELSGVDVFVCTADSTKEPTMEVMNTVLSALALDYPSDKLSVYLSDDGGSSITLLGMKEAGVFARRWIPFCKKYDIKIRCPDAYFSGLGDDDRLLRNDEFKEEEQEIKLKYNQFKDRLEKSNENASTSQDRDPLIEIILGNEESHAEEEEKMPRLVYVSRERRPIYPHRFKAGALNSLLRVSGIISNAPYILVLDCDMYCNDPTSAKQAMCFHLDPKLSSSLAFVQFPQIFYNVSKNDIYDGQARGAYKTKWQGMDGLRGPVLSGTGFYMKRQALYGSPKQQDAYLSEPKSCFGPSNKFIKSVCHDYECNDNEDSLHSLTQEAGFLASCAYEKNTQWGDQIGFSYKCLLESTFTGYLLHCKGWTSVYCYPKKPCFLGCTTMNMKDAMVQAMKWCTGLFQVAISSYCPLTYGMSRMSALQSLCYAYFTFQPLFAAALLIYAIVPQLYLANGIPLYPKVSSPWFAVFSIIYVSSLCQHFIEVLSSGGTITTWWNEQRIWMIKSVTAYLFGCADVIMKWIGIAKASFRLTNKAIDQEQQKKYEKGKFDFEGATMFMIPLIILVIFNMGCFIVGARRMIIDQSYEEMFGQVFLSFFILVLSYPILEGVITRKKGQL